MNWDMIDSLVDMVLLGSNVGPMLKKLFPMLKRLIKFEAPTGAQFADAAAAAAEFDKRFEQTQDDENFFERVRSALRLNNDEYDRNLSVLISGLKEPGQKKALRRLIFAGMETAGIDGGAYILANLASRGPNFDDMKARFDEMDLAIQEAKDPKKAAERFAEAWKKIEPAVSARWHETALEFNLALTEAKEQLRQPVPLKTLFFLDGIRMPSLPTTTRGKLVLVMVIVLIVMDLIYGFTPKN